MFYGIDIILQNIFHIQSECEEYFAYRKFLCLRTYYISFEGLHILDEIHLNFSLNIIVDLALSSNLTKLKLYVHTHTYTYSSNFIQIIPM